MDERTSDAPPRSAAALARALVDARDQTLRVYRHLTPAQQRFAQIPIVNLPRWELGHIGWFQEFWCRRYRPAHPRGGHAPSRLAEADAWWDSARVAHATRWQLALPDWPAIDRYLADTLADTLLLLDQSREGERYFFELALYHEDMHGEALLMTLQTLALPEPPRPPLPVAETSVEMDIVLPGTTMVLGAPRGAEAHRFVFDNEKWGHDVEVEPFAIATRCVTNASFAAFVDAGGYQRRELWSDDGWQWRERQDTGHPAYWRHSSGQWRERRFDAWQALAAAEAVRHVNAFEAEAYCTWAGRRLPTEAQWQYAAPSLQTGDLWEWTGTTFMPYPGFAADPYMEYSAPWFGDHRVLRGGSFATPCRLVHPNFRNFYRPERYDMFVGFRTCA